jgi:hypothetical protein
MPRNPHDVNKSMQSSSVEHPSDRSMSALTLCRICSHFAFGVGALVVAVALAESVIAGAAAASTFAIVGDGFSSGVGTRRVPLSIVTTPELELEE